MKKKSKQKLKQEKQLNIEEAIKITKEITELVKDNIKNFWEISKRLKEIRDGKGWKYIQKPNGEKCKSFEDYCENLFEWTRRTAYSYIKTKEYIEKYHPNVQMSAQIDYTKIELLSGLDKPEFEEFRDELDKKVFNNEISYRELEEEIKKIKGKEEEWLRFLDVWNFKENIGEGISNLPPEILKNLLYYYTKKGDLIVDCFAGSGQIKEIANEMNRKCFCSDIKPLKSFIKKWDVNKGFPKEIKTCDFIFLDPPYWNMINYGEGWSNIPLKEFYAKFEAFVKECDRVLKEDGKIALIIMPLKYKGEYIDLGFNCYKIIEKYFKVIQRLCVPLYKNWSLDPRVKKCKENKEILTGSLRDLIIFEKNE